MKNFKVLLVLIAIAGFAVSCGGNKKQVATQAADEMCKCAKISLDYKKKVEAAGTDVDKLAALSKEGQQVISETSSCMTSLEEKYKKVQENQDFQDAVMTAMKAKCPDAAAALNQ